MRTPPPLPTETILDPYVGLRPYTDSDDDRARFFGREQDREIIIANLYAAPLTVFYGASGVGKSSVLLAGVAPELRQTPRFACVVFRTWQSEKVLPLLKAAILDAVRAAAKTEIEIDATLPLDDFLLQCIRAFRGRVVVIFDQFEEYFLYHAASAVSEGFDAEFARSVNRNEIDASFLLSMREDGLSKLDRFQGRIPKLLNNLLRLDHLGRDAAISAIREPLAACNKRLPPGQPPASIDDDLVEALLDQLKTGSVTLDPARQPAAAVVNAAPVNGETWIETPFLQIVLTRLWEEEKKHGSRQLRLATLNKLGGAPRILRTHLDKTMRKVKRRQRRIAVDIFGYLVTPSGGKIAHTVDDLASYSRRRKSRLAPLLQRLTDPNIRVLRTISPPSGEPEGVRYEIFHDVLAAAVLTWRRRKLVWRRVWRVIRWTLGVGIAVFLTLLTIGFAVIEEEKKTKTALERAEANWAVVVEMDKAVPYSRAVIRGRVYQVTCSQDGKRVAAAGDGTAGVWDTVTGKLLFELEGSRQAIGGVFFSPAGNLIATGDYDNAVRLWDAATGHFLRELLGHKKPLTMVAFSPNGHRVVAASEDGTASVWEAGTGKLISTLRGHTSAVNSAFFSPMSDLVITASTDHSARIWDAATGTSVRELTGHKASLYKAMFSPDGTLALTVSLDKTARVWDTATGNVQATLSGHRDVVFDGVFSPDNRLVATASADGTARIWDAKSGEVKAELRGHTGYVHGVAFSPDGRRVVTASDDNTARLWDAASGRIEAVLRGHIRDVTSAQFTPNGKFVVTASSDGTVRVWAPSGARSFLALKHDAEMEIYGAKWSRNSQLIVTASSDGTACVWDLKGAPVAKLLGHSREVQSAEFSPDDDAIVTASRDNTGALWNAQTGERILTLNGHADWVSSASFSPDGNSIVTTSWDHTARLWNREGEKLHVLQHDSEVDYAAFSRDSKVLVTACEDGTVKAWHTQTGELFLDLPGHTAKVAAIAFSPVDNQHLVTASEDGSAFVWTLVEGVKPIPLRLKGDSYRLTNARFSPDGSMVVISSQDCTAHVCDARTGEEIANLKHTDVVWDAAFSPNSKLVVTASGDGSARVWEARSGLQLAELREHTGDVNSAAFSPNGKFIVTASVDGTARVWKVGDW